MPEGLDADLHAALLDDLLAIASRSLDTSTGGAAMCTFTKAGIAVPGMKYAEGRWAALREVRRSTSTTASVRVATAATRATWHAALEKARAQAAGADWIAYRSGGIDALDELAASLSAEASSAPP